MNRKNAFPYDISMRKHFLNYIIILIVTIVYSAGVGLFLDPNNIAPGGVTGIAIILNDLIPVETGTLILLLNIPILLLGIWKFGFKFILSTLFAIVLISEFTNLWAFVPTPTTDRMLASIIGSALVSGSVGIIFKCGATTGGIDIIVKILRQRYQHLKTGVIFWMLDIVVVLLSGFAFGNLETALYGSIGVIVSAWILDLVLYGRDEAKFYLIISKHSHEIASVLLERLGVGVTYLSGTGAYNQEEKQIIMCVIKKQRSPKLEEIVKEVDMDAFTIVTRANEIFGEGFKNIAGERL